MDGMGFRRALACGIRGTPCMTRGSFIKVVSSFAGTGREQRQRNLLCTPVSPPLLTSADDLPVVTREVSIWRCRGCRTPQVVGDVGEEVGV